MVDKKKVAALILLLCITKKHRNRIRIKKRRVWMKTFLSLRHELGFQDGLINELRLQDPEEYRRFLRMDGTIYEDLLKRVSPLITKQDTPFRDAIPAALRLSLTLRYLAQGESKDDLHLYFRIGKSSVCRIINQTVEAIYEALHLEFLKFPSTPEEWKQIAKEFKEKWQYDVAIGALDGKHINMKCPPNSGSWYFNYKGDFSIVMLALVDANLKALYIDVGANGREHDSSIFNRSSLKKGIDANSIGIPLSHALPGRCLPVEYVIVADDAFALQNHVMKPYPDRGLQLKQRIYNYRHSRARRTSENFFGIFSNRFRLFLKPIEAMPQNVKNYALAAVALHNYLYAKNVNYCLASEIYDDVLNSSVRKPTCNLPNIRHQVGNRSSVRAQEIRNELCEYFISEGAVEWQLAKI